MPPFPPSTARSLVALIFSKFQVQTPVWVARMELGHLLDLPRHHPHLEALILAEQPFHILAGPGPYQSVSQISASLQVCGTSAVGKWALYPVPFQSARWQGHFLRLAGYHNHIEILPGYTHARAPFTWPSVNDRPGMLWEFSAEGDDLAEFYAQLKQVVSVLHQLCEDVLRATAGEYAFQVASSTTYDYPYPPPERPG